jgi:aminopeptidase YwaD
VVEDLVLRRTPLRLAALSLPLWLLVAACSGDSSPEPTPSPGPSPTPEAAAPVAPPASQAAVEPDGDRILGYVRALSEDIGPRPAGTAAEQRAVDFISGLLRSFGYEVSVQDFPISNEANRDSRVEVTSPAPRTLSSLPFARSAAATVNGRLIPSGIGRPDEFPASVSGNIALIERGELTFQDKVRNATSAGARAVIIFNNGSGTFFGSLSEDSTIPAASISGEEGEDLVRAANAGAVEARVSVGAVGSAVGHNVIARPPGRECETVTGGHFDSVLQAPGASDNATGTATVIEIAGVLSGSGQMGGHCFVLFGAEEIGLVGSRAYVNSLNGDQRSRLRAVLNLDMVGVGDETWLLIGNATLQERAEGVADRLEMGARRGNLGNASSDHASFIGAGIPALMLHRTDDPLLHTPQDVAARVRPQLLEEAARFGIAFLQESTAGGG